MKGTKHIITTAQEAWLIEHYSDTKNADILEHLGWDANQGRSLRRIAALLGLQKSRDFMHQAQTNAMEHARIANQGEGNAGAKNLLLYGVAHRFKKGENNIQRIGAEREAARLKKSHDSRCETIRKRANPHKLGLRTKNQDEAHTRRRGTNQRAPRPKEARIHRTTPRRENHLLRQPNTAQPPGGGACHEARLYNR